MKTQRYKVFPNLYVKKINKEYFGIFHPFTLKTKYVSMKYYPMLEFLQYPKSLEAIKEKFLLSANVKSCFEDLYMNEVIVNEAFSYEDKIRTIREKIISQRPLLRVAYFVLTEFCNLDCTYCFVNGGMSSRYKRKQMSLETAVESVVFFLDNAHWDKDKSPRIIFYGGEPLLNVETLKLIIAIVRKYDRKHMKKLPIGISLNTNATLITKDIAIFLVRNNVAVGVSLDGFSEHHDYCRPTANQNGSFHKTMSGYRILQKEGGNPAIACTVGIHNVHYLPEIARFFVTELKPAAMGFSPMFETLLKKNNSLAPIRQVVRALISAFEIAREHNIYEERVGRLFHSTGELKFRSYDCSGCGDQLVFNVDGNIGQCPAWCTAKKYSLGNVYNYRKTSQSIFDHSILKLWRKRTPVNMKDCHSCPAILFCGGGCGYHAEITDGALFGRDKRLCEFYKYFLPWYMQDVYKRGGADVFCKENF